MEPSSDDQPRTSDLASSSGEGSRSSAAGPPAQSPVGFMGKHRMAAAVASLDHQIQLIQEELQRLETLGESSIVCKETKGPKEVGWDRWFQGANGSRRQKRWI
nr:guanine nucleotide-binding protein subunit gamma 2-like [Ipomoea batatas]GMD04730.1 guanine nucleotide-binding protein subunit gamma 2-like [Ipomoea batatas]GMD10898.1 guanine nucleotide-binding protein subunit gamma 2-like [Ipomoea batatas]